MIKSRTETAPLLVEVVKHFGGIFHGISDQLVRLGSRSRRCLLPGFSLQILMIVPAEMVETFDDSAPQPIF